MFEISKAIYTLLTGSTTLLSLVPVGNINSVIIPNNISFPAIVFKRSGNVNYTKDYCSDVEYNIEITVYSNKSYDSSIDIITEINNILNNYNGIINGLYIVDCRLQNFDEDYVEDCLVQVLNYSIKTRYIEIPLPILEENTYIENDYVDEYFI